jgi:protein gp37
MAAVTGISWAHSTLNYWIGCSKVSAACDHCYAERDWDHRKHRVQWGPRGDRSPTKTWEAPYKWQREASAFFQAHGERRRVFVNSLSDWGDNHRSIGQDWRDAGHRAWRDCPDLDFLILTKRPGNLLKPGFLPADWSAERYPNVWIGTTVENQEAADMRLQVLERIEARVRFASIEPLLEDIQILQYLAWLDWVLVGGESGPHARHFDDDWARHILRDCRRADVLRTGRRPVAFHLKQRSQADHPSTFRNFDSFPADLRLREVPLP